MRRPLACLFGAALALSNVMEAEASSAMTALATEVAKGLGQVPAGAFVVASPLSSDLPPTRGDELALRIAQVAAGKLGGAARAHDHTLQLSAARAVAGRGSALVYLSLEIARGELRVTADLYPVMANGWDRIRIPAPPPRAHTYASAPLDAEVRAFLPPITLEHAQLHKAHHDEGEVLAAACGDVDADGGMELVLVSKSRVALGNVRGDKFMVRKAAPWSGLSRRVPVPLREPLAGAAFVGQRLFAGTTEREAVELDGALGVVRTPLSGIPLPLGDADGCAAINAEASAFEGDVLSCGRDHASRVTSPVSRYDAFAAADVIARDGKPHRVVAAREPTGKLRVFLDSAESKPVDGAGAQLATGDLDLDGRPEVITSSDGPDDGVTIYSVGSAEPRLRKKIPAPSGVRALAVCPPEEHGVPALVAVVGSEVWLVR